MAISLSCTPPFPTHSMLDPHHVYSPTPSCTMVSNVPLLSQAIPSASSSSFWSTSCFTLEEPSEASAFHVSLLARLPLISRIQLRLGLALYPVLTLISFPSSRLQAWHLRSSCRLVLPTLPPAIFS